jgi:fumarate reductase subunit D
VAIPLSRPRLTANRIKTLIMESSFMPAILMSLLSLACLVIVLTGYRKSLALAGLGQQRRQKKFSIALIGIVAWVAIMGVLAANGFFENFTSLPPRLILVPVLGFFVVLMITFSKGFTNLLRTTPPHWLIYFQSFRILVELLLWVAFTRGLLPEQMTFDGYNFDIISGVLALPVGWLLQQRKSYARVIGIVYNFIGLLLLFNIITIAVLSMPTPFRQFMNEPANVIVSTFPFVYLPGVLVVLAFTFHVFSLRQLLTLRQPYSEISQKAASAYKPQQFS